MATLLINPKLEIQASWIDDQHTCVVIDDFLLDPEQAIEHACANRDDFVQLERAYPGFILPADGDMMRDINRFIQRKLSKLFPICRGGMEFHSQFSLATVLPEEFTWIQRLCHTDPRLAPGRVNYAALIYLFENPEMGGTGFFQWKDQAFWQEMAVAQRDDPDAGLDVLHDKFQMFRDPPCYMTDSNEAADLLDTVPAKFNRLVFYSGDLPHSASIARPDLLSRDPEEGRLTLNCFVNALPK